MREIPLYTGTSQLTPSLRTTMQPHASGYCRVLG